jgi:hypothetical protein
MRGGDGQAYQLPWRLLAAKSSLRALRGRETFKICKNLSNSKNMVFKVKKQLNHWLGPDDTARGRKKQV